MRQRYLLTVARELIDQTFAEELASRTNLSRAYRAPGLLLLTNDAEQIIVLQNDGGFIIGKLFHRCGYPEAIKSLSLDEQVKIIETGGKHLTERYWGSYIAALVSRNDVNVVRDPSGGIPCYYSSYNGLKAFTSDATILVDTGLVRPSVDAEAIGRILFRHQLPTEKTAIFGISQILAGCGLVISPDSTSGRRLWNPWNYIERNSRTSEASSILLERIVRSTLSSWASAYPKPLIGLSGGLDSSIVTVCLAHAGTKPTCLTLRTSDPRGDEYYYATTLCNAVNATILSRTYDSAHINLDRSVAADVPIPSGKSHEQAYNFAVRRIAEEIDIDSFFVGAGGDNVFYQTHSARPLVDRFKAEGWSRGVWDTLRDTCEITGASALAVLREATRLVRQRSTGIRWHDAPEYLHHDVITSEQTRHLEHPWVDAPGSAPLGKIGHVTMLLRAMNHIEHRDKDLSVPMISPLLSQPIVEACLGIASWEHCSGGVDRSVARAAFSSSLPPIVAGRYGKGSPDGFVAHFIDIKRSEIADRLLNGQLAASNLLDRAALERALRPDSLLRSNDCPRLMALLDTEAWITEWNARQACWAPSHYRSGALVVSGDQSDAGSPSPTN